MWLTLACASDLTTPPDADGDGWHAGDDCDDADDAVHPDAAEVCGNGVDDDCDLAAPGCGLFGEVEGEDPLQGPSEGDGDVGSALAMVGDEIATGAPDAAIVYDARTMVPWIVGSTASFGTALVGGDFDGDGVADLAVGARPAAEDAPEVWLFLAPGDALVEADADLVDDARDARDDVTLTGPCDLDGDGTDDLVLTRSATEGDGWLVEVAALEATPSRRSGARSPVAASPLALPAATVTGTAWPRWPGPTPPAA